MINRLLISNLVGIVFFLCYVAISTQSFAQSVDLITGRLQMSVPLGQLQANDISIPIGISHHGGALRVAEGEGACGLGWNLSGGSVARVVRGLPDEMNLSTRKGWLYNSNAQNVQSFSPLGDDDLTTCDPNEGLDWGFLDTNFGAYNNDSEPDIFYVHAPGLSAQFIFGTDGLPKLLIHQDIFIQYNADSIVVRPNNGLVYRFDKKEQITRRGYVGNAFYMNTDCSYYRDNDWTFTSQWKLSSIRSIVTGTKAKFHYTEIQDGAGRNNLNADSSNYLIDVYSRQQLDSIVLKSYKAYFEWKNSLLQRFTITEAITQDKKEVAFEYKSASQSGTTVWKAFLSNIQFLGGSCQTYEAYGFEYKDVVLSSTEATKPSHVDWRRYSGQDFFGYPNGVSTNKNRPRLYAYMNESDGRRLRVQPIPGLPAAETAGDNRSVRTSHSFGALIKVILPTGGYTEIKYDSNRYVDNSTNEEFTAGGLRVQKLISQGGEIAFGKSIDATTSYRAIVKEYEYRNAANTFSSGVILSPIKLGYITRHGVLQAVNNLGEDDPDVMYTRVKEKVSGQGYTVYEFSIPGVFPETVSGDWKATKSRIARSSTGTCKTPGNIKNGYYIFPYAPSTNYTFKRGQLSKVTAYTETNVPVREKTYNYSRRTSNPLTIKGLRFEKIDGVFHYGLYEIITGNMEVISQEVAKEASHENTSLWIQSTTNYAYNANHHLLESVTTNLPNSTTTVKRFKYAKDFPFTTPPSTDTAAVAIKALNDNFMGSAPIEQATKITVPGSTEKVAGAQLTIYRNFGNNKILPYYTKALPTGVAFTEASMSGQNFSADTDYKMVSILKEYDEEGRLLTTMDEMKNYGATHYVKDPSLPIATFTNVKAQQCVYEGFEMVSSFGLVTNGSGFQSVAGWTGEKGMRFTNGSALISSATKQIQKNGNKYRVSCWIYSSQNKTITFNAKNGSTTNAMLTLTNPLNNQWNYLEGEINVTSVASPFTLEIVTNANAGTPVTVDDIVFMPSHGRVSMQTLMPFKGATSATDDRGNSIKNTFDHMGRLYDSFDRNRNLVQRKEYNIKNTFPVKPSAAFSANTDQHLVNNPVTFTPTTWTCDAGATYIWNIDGGANITGGIGGVLTHTFTTPGNHSIKLTTTASSGSSAAFTETFCVEYLFTSSIQTVVTDINGNPASLVLDCNSGHRNITLVIPSIPTGCTYTIQWSKNGVGGFATGEAISVYGFSPSGTEPVDDLYQAYIVMDCSAFKDCTFGSPTVYSGTIGVSVHNVPNPNCQ